MTAEQRIRELAEQLAEVADFGSLTREDALATFTQAYFTQPCPVVDDETHRFGIQESGRCMGCGSTR